MVELEYKVKPCFGCLYFKTCGFHIGQCRKKSPSIERHESCGFTEQRPVWPVVSDDDWCGDYLDRVLNDYDGN